jgi:hypothetical protein
MSEVCSQLHRIISNLERYRFPFDATCLPKNGIYLLFENGETGHGGSRLVRVGTHTGDHQLRSRLRQHFVKENKDRSIFRKNIGRAILNKDGDPFLAQWEIDLTSRKSKETSGALVDRAKQAEIEKRVSAYIRANFVFSVIEIECKSRRLELEAKLISTVSLCSDCHPSGNWLGHYSPKKKIRESGLWLVNELYGKPLAEEDYEILEAMSSSQLLEERAHQLLHTLGRNPCD